MRKCLLFILISSIQLLSAQVSILLTNKVIGDLNQPFFITKPTGEGTGLGLSLSYDIIKAHNGELKINSKEGEGAEFIIVLPVV